jgi:hypothetical protein
MPAPPSISSDGVSSSSSPLQLASSTEHASNQNNVARFIWRDA